MYSRRFCYTLTILAALVATTISRGGSAPLVGRQNKALASGVSRSLAALPLQTAGATITVNDKGDSTANDGKCTLREAIIAANTNAPSGGVAGECAAGTTGADLILFNVGSQGTATINPTSPLPTITAPVTIKGNSGGLTNVEINGSAAGTSANGLSISAGNTIIQRLVINNFTGAGIYISGNGSNIVRGCFIGTNSSGMAKNGSGNGVGISIDGSSNNTIGGTASGERNIISGNTGTGILIAAGTSGIPVASGNQVIGNFVGTDFIGRGAVGNGAAGIAIVGGTNTTIGGDTPEERNVISGNNSGISITNNASGNNITGNFIGSDITGLSPLDNGTGSGNLNSGITINSSSNNTIGGLLPQEGNTIRFNQGVAGSISITGPNANGNRVVGNVISDNGGLLAIGLSGGANNSAATPEITDITSNTSNNSDTIIGKFDAEPNTTYRLEFFVSSRCPSLVMPPPLPSVAGGQGQTLFYTSNVTSMPGTTSQLVQGWVVNFSVVPKYTSGVDELNYQIQPSQYVTLTATKLDSQGAPVETSPISQCFQKQGLSDCDKLVVDYSNLTLAGAGGTTRLNVSYKAGCPLTVSSDESWISYQVGTPQTVGTPPLQQFTESTVAVTVAANTGSIRTGKVKLNDQIYGIIQDGACAGIVYSPGLIPYTKGDRTFTLFSGSSCNWQATINPAITWARLTNAVTGTGPGYLDYSVDQNDGKIARMAPVKISFPPNPDINAIIRQNPKCGVTISPTSKFAVTAGESGTILVTVDSSCTESWKAAVSYLNNEDTGWITLANSTGSGNGTIGYTIAANTTTVQRSGIITVYTGTDTLSGQKFIVSQGPGCLVSLEKYNNDLKASSAITQLDVAASPGGAQSIDVKVGSGCPWQATTIADWITITSGSGTGNGTLAFNVASNSTGKRRKGVIRVSGTDLTVYQDPTNPCKFTLTPDSQSIASKGGSGTLSIATNSSCAWKVTTGSSWIRITSTPKGTGNGTVEYSADTNGTGVNRSGILSVGEDVPDGTQSLVVPALLTVNQNGGCKYTVTPTTRSVASAADKEVVSVTTDAGCEWESFSNVPWITFTASSPYQRISIANSQGRASSKGGRSGTAASGSGSVNYYFAENKGPARTGSISVAGTTIQVSQAAGSTIAISPSSLNAVPAGVSYSQQFSQTGATGGVTWSVNSGTLPTGLTLSSGGLLSGTPTIPATYGVTIRATDSSGSYGEKKYDLQISCPTLTITPRALPPAANGSAYDQTMMLSGGSGSVGWEVVSGSLPQGISLGATTGRFTGTPTMTGTYSFKVRATLLASNCYAEQAMLISVGCPTVAADPLSEGRVGTSYSHQFIQTGYSGNISNVNWAVRSGSLPPGLTLNAAGLLSGVPTQPGTYTFTVRASVTGSTVNCYGEVFCTLKVGCEATITPGTLSDVFIGDNYSQQLTQSGYSGSVTWKVSAGALPPGLTLSSGGLISGVPTLSGSFTFAIRVELVGGPSGCYGEVNYTLLIKCQSALSIAPATIAAPLAGNAYDQLLTLNGGAGQVTWSVVGGSLPNGISLGSQTGRLAGVPRVTGTYSFTIRGAVSSTGCFADQTYTVVINCPTVSVVTSSIGEGKVGVAFNQQLVQSGGAGAMIWTVTSGTLPNNIALSRDGLLFGTPTSTGISQLTVRAMDENGCYGERSFVFIIGLCPTITVAPAVLPGGTIGTSYSQTLTATGGTGGYTFAYTGDLPRGLTLLPNGLLSGVATVVGAYNFVVTATDQTGCTGTRSYTLVICANITVNPSTLPAGETGKAYSQRLGAVGGNFPQTFSYTGTLPPGLALSASGQLTGTPTQAGTYNFTVVATGTISCSGSRTYALEIRQRGLMFYALSRPLRLLDTRAGQSACDAPGQQLQAGSPRTQTVAGRTCGTISIPAAARALTGNITTYQNSAGTLTLYPSDSPQPNVVNQHYQAGQPATNGFTVGLGAGDGAFTILTSSSADVVIEVTGYYAPPGSGGLYFHTLSGPMRLLDTRSDKSACFTPKSKLAAGSELTPQGRIFCGGKTIPQSAVALVGSVATYGPSAQGMITLYPGNITPRPVATTSSFASGQSISSSFTVTLAPDGTFKVYSSATTDLSIDIVGYYSQNAADLNGPGELFHALARPVRLLETRSGQPGCFTPGAPLASNATRVQPVVGVCDGMTINSNARTLVFNATLVSPTADGQVIFWSGVGVPPESAGIGYQAGKTLTREAVARLGNDGGLRIFTNSVTDLLIDIFGFFAP